MGHGNTDVFESSDSGSVVSSRQREGPPDSSAGWTPGNFEGFLLDTFFATELGSLCRHASGGLLFTRSLVQICDYVRSIRLMICNHKVSASLLYQHAENFLMGAFQLQT